MSTSAEFFGSGRTRPAWYAEVSQFTSGVSNE
jgi:hypothetical protein